MIIDPAQSETKDVYRYMVGSVCPRPIAFASTLDGDGQPNLAPYSFFNAFGANPPTLIFSSSRRIKDNTTKHTYENTCEIDEVVINIVTYDIAEQMVLTSTEYPRGVDEFKKAGFTPEPSAKVKPFRAKESPVNYECRVKEVRPMGEEAGAGNLIICEVVCINVDDHVLDENGRIDAVKLDPMGRLGGFWYTRASQGLMEIPTPQGTDNIGMDGLPDAIKHSSLLTGNELAQLGKLQEMPSLPEVEEYENDPANQGLIKGEADEKYQEEVLQKAAKELLYNRETEKALKVLLFNKKELLKS